MDSGPAPAFMGVTGVWIPAFAGMTEQAERTEEAGRTDGRWWWCGFETRLYVLQASLTVLGPWIPAAPLLLWVLSGVWIPAFAGMTEEAG